MKTEASKEALFSSHQLDPSLLDYIQKYGDKNKFQEEVEEVLKGVPVQYVVGNVDFFHSQLEVNPSVLIPRFETEELCEKVIQRLKQKKKKELSIADIGTGSGCIAITMKQEFPQAKVVGTDISKDALEVAKRNGEKNKVDIEWLEGDLLEPLSGIFDCIISNPPYIDEQDPAVMDMVKKYEPHLALFAEEQGYACYHKILKNIKPYLKTNYLIAFEIGYQQRQHLDKYAKELFPDAIVEVEKDLSGNDRFLLINKEE